MYKRIRFEDCTVDNIKALFDNVQYKHTHCVRHWYNCALVPCGFDIETTAEFMYIWTFTIYDTTIIGYTWAQFGKLLKVLASVLHLGKKEEGKSATVLPIFIHNFGGFEWHFIKGYFRLTDYFVRGRFANDDPAMYAVINDSFLLVDSYLISNMSLEKMAKVYCITQKTKDLDYSVERNPEDAKHLTEEELTYCCNDSIICREFADYVFYEYFIPYGKLPLTQNQIVQARVNYEFEQEKKMLSKEEYDNRKKLLAREMLSIPEYKFIRKYGYRGGYCASSGQIAFKVGYGDLDSAYTSAAVHGYYPRGAYHKGVASTWKKKVGKYCCQLWVRFKGLKAKQAWLLYESNTRIAIRRSNKVRTNPSGRIYYAEDIEVSLTEIDLKMYYKLYTWESMEVKKIYWAERGPLPNPIIRAFVGFYYDKAILKKNGKEDTPEYKRLKQLPSTISGACGKRVQEKELKGCDTDWIKNHLKDKLRPQWGVYITAHVRELMINMILELGFKFWLYTDTDSLYYVLTKESKAILERFNEEQRYKNKLFCMEYGYDYSIMDDLGTFDDGSRKHLKIDAFVTTGAKSYAYHYYDDKHPEGDYKIVQSGIPDDVLKEAWLESGLDFIEYFSESDRVITFTRKEAKITHNTSRVINGIECYSYRGVRIEEKTYTGTIRYLKNRLAFERIMQEIEDPRDYNFE